MTFDSYAKNLAAADTNGHLIDVFLRDRQTGQTSLVSVDSSGAAADSGSYWPTISGDGRYVAFHSYATNLVPGDTNGQIDVFVHDRASSRTTRVSLDANGAQATSTVQWASVSGDGSVVVFLSDAPLVADDTNGQYDVFVAPMP